MSETDSRRERLDALRESGVDPFPARAGDHIPVSEVNERFGSVSGEQLETDASVVGLCGRIMAVRSIGKLVFLKLLENGSTLQLSVQKKNVEPELFAFVKKLDVGDFVRVEGPLWRTRTEELTLDIREATLLAKSLRPMPEKWHGLQDVETRFRRRHLDLLVNEDARRIALMRSRTITAMRAFLDERGFLEVETPTLQPLYGGAAARPFTTYHNVYGQTLYLRISDELYLKRLVAGGLDRVYEIAHNFRNEGVSRKHNPEFTSMECYQAYADYRDMMQLTEEMVAYIAKQVLGTTQIEFQGTPIDLARWQRVSLRDAILEATGLDFSELADLESLRAEVRAKGLGAADASSWAKLVDDLFSDHVEPKLQEPTFVTDYPVALSPLAKRTPDNPALVERFEPYIGGMELGNAFSELNDPDDQRARLEAERDAHAAGDEEAHPLDEDYLLTLEYGLPPTGGLGIGIDRLVMVLADAPNLREVILFPHMRTAAPSPAGADTPDSEVSDRQSPRGTGSPGPAGKDN